MGGCLTKKSVCATSSPVTVPIQPEKSKSESELEKKKAEEEIVAKREISVIKHRKSSDVERGNSDEGKVEAKKAEEIVENGLINVPIEKVTVNGNCGFIGGAAVRTASCTKEEVDAILIQCGRLSRTSSAGKALQTTESGRKYSGTKRSFDFDNDNGKSEGNNDEEAVARERENRRREKHRHHSQGRRRTPSREREKDLAAQSRSGSRERIGAAAGRRTSRSPGRRSDSPITTNSNSNSSANSRPGKLVSVPATVAIDKSTNDEANIVSAVKRIQVKRNTGGDLGTRTAASPRARSPARVRVSNENQNVSLSRSNSRKAENSPYRRNPLSEIDANIIPSQVSHQKPNAENNKTYSTKTAEETKEQYDYVAMNVISSSQDNNLKPQILARSRYSMLSRDLDGNHGSSSNPNSSSYTALLLEDIQNFHQKNNKDNTPPIALPPCVTKACSILEAVAGLNNPTNETRDPILESVVVANDDLMEPSFHKYVTVRRGGMDDLDDQESSGSNSVAGSQQHWLSSSCWEPNSANSPDRWAGSASSSARTVSKQSSMAETGEDGGKRGGGGAKRREYSEHNGIGRGRIGNKSAAT